MTDLKKNKRIKTGDIVIDKLYEAVREYVEKNKGTVIVIGGIAVVRESSLKYNYGIMVRCTGKPPQTIQPIKL